MANVNSYYTSLADDGFSGTVEFNSFTASFAGGEHVATPTSHSDVQFSAGNAPSFPAYFSQLYADQTPFPVVLQNMNPAVKGNLVSTQPITFELAVTPPALLDHGVNGRVIVWVLYPDLNGQTEVVYDGEKFTAAFDGNGKTEDTLDQGEFVHRKFTVLRNGGWPARPRLFIHANTDRGGLN